MDVAAQTRDEPLHSRVAVPDADEAPEKREQNTLGEELTDQARTVAAHRHSQRHLLLTIGGAREEEVRHIRARDQEDQDHRPEKQQQRRPQVADHGVQHRLHRHALTGVGHGMLLSEPFRESLDIGSRLLHRDALLHAPDHVDPGMVAALVLAADLVLEEQKGGEGVGGFPRGVKGARHDPDHVETLAAQGERLAHDVRVAPEPSVPEAFAEKNHAGSSGFVFLGCERAAEDRRLLERVEHSRRHLADIDPLGLGPRSGENETRAVRPEYGVEDLVLVAQVLEVRHREAHLRHLLRPFGQEHQPVGLAIGEGPEQNRVHHTEHRGVGADAEGQGQHRDGGEALRLTQHAGPVLDVTPQVFHESLSPGKQTSTYPH